jgi:hypothetical protein
MPDLSLTALARGIREAGREATIAAGLAHRLPRYLRRRVTFGEARERFRYRLAHREQSFLGVVRRAIYEHPTSPYLALLRNAGCELGDVERLVAEEGIEGALAILAAQGVYVTFDELKGRREAVRGSARFRFSEQAFDSPLFKFEFFVYTSGTGGRPSEVGRSVEFLSEATSSTAVALWAHGVDDARQIFWVTWPITPLLGYPTLGLEIVRWYQGAPSLPFKVRAGGRLVVLSGRLAGRRIPVPRFLDLERAADLAAWIGRRPRDGRPLMVSTLTSKAVRIAVAAREQGIDLTGVTFRLQSEPLTDARYAHLSTTGAAVIDNYSLIEATDIAWSCAVPGAAQNLHVFADRFAMIGRDRLVAEGGPSVNALLITTLTELAPKICFNTESGDYGRLETRGCGCELGALGLTTQLSEIRSFEKLSTEGVAFLRTSLLHVIEAVLPSRFGGSSVDYQLLEEEAPDGVGRLVLRVSPSVGPVDEATLRAAFLDGLGSGGGVERHYAELLRRAGSVIVSRQPPLATAAGKVFPFHLLRAPRAVRSASAP